MKRFRLFISYCLLCFPPLLLASPTLEFIVNGIENSEMQKNALLLLTEKKGKNALTRDRIEDVYRDGPQEIKEALQPFGYFNVTIKSTLHHRGDSSFATYDVLIGPALLISHLDVQVTGEGINDPAFTRVLGKLPLHVGDRFTTEAYENIKKALSDVANNNGYINASFSKKQVEIDLPRYRAIIHLTLTTGPRFYFGTIAIADNFFSGNFLRRFAPFYRGDPYATEQLLRYQNNLTNSDYFSDVVIVPQAADATHHIPINVKVKPVKAQRFTLAGGYGTDTGVRGSLGWQWRRITSGGQHFSTNLGISQFIGVNFNSTYYIPGSDPVTEMYTLTANIYNFKTDAGSYFNQSYGVNYLTHYRLWQNAYSLLFVDETFTPEGEIKQRSHLLMPSVTLSRLVTDNPIRPKFGQRISFNMRGATTALSSAVNFLQNRVDVKGVQPLWPNSRLVSRLSFGATITDEFDRIPLSLRFTAGGATSVRGYGFQSLGPGKFLLTTTVEWQQRVYGNFYAGWFYDAGNAFNQFSQEAPLLKSSTGLGIIWDSPIGSIELSIAKPFDRDKSALAFDVSMGALL